MPERVYNPARILNRITTAVTMRKQQYANSDTQKHEMVEQKRKAAHTPTDAQTRTKTQLLTQINPEPLTITTFFQCQKIRVYYVVFKTKKWKKNFGGPPRPRASRRRRTTRWEHKFSSHTIADLIPSMRAYSINLPLRMHYYRVSHTWNIENKYSSICYVGIARASKKPHFISITPHFFYKMRKFFVFLETTY